MPARRRPMTAAVRPRARGPRLGAVHNADIAAAFNEIADLLEIEEANPFRIRAYRNAARIVADLRFDIAAHLAQGKKLPKLPWIGEDLGGKIREIAATGTCALAERLRKRLPAGVTELLRIPGLGPKRVRALYRELGVHTPMQLQRAARDGRLKGLAGFGEKTEERIRDALAHQGAGPQRFKLAIAARYADSLADHLRKVRGVRQVAVAGSFRRMKDTVGDLDILVAAPPSAPVMDRFTGYDEVREVLARGETRASVVLKSGLQVDLRLVPEETYGAALHYFTGSKAHNIAVRRLGQARGFKVNEYGVFRGTRRGAGATEESVFAAVGLPFIAPELRVDRGEIEAARAGTLPQRVVLADLRGDLHVHTKASDGRDTLRDSGTGGARAQARLHHFDTER